MLDTYRIQVSEGRIEDGREYRNEMPAMILPGRSGSFCRQRKRAMWKEVGNLKSFAGRGEHPGQNAAFQRRRRGSSLNDGGERETIITTPPLSQLTQPQIHKAASSTQPWKTAWYKRTASVVTDLVELTEHV